MNARTLGGLIFSAIMFAQAAGGQDGKQLARRGPVEQSLIVSIRGADLYKAYCASCHGESGKGNGPMAGWLKVSPADLTGIAARNGGKFPRARVDRVISGEEKLPTHGTNAMPVWGPIFSQVTHDQDLGRVRIDNLARFLSDLQAK